MSKNLIHNNILYLKILKLPVTKRQFSNIKIISQIILFKIISLLKSQTILLIIIMKYKHSFWFLYEV